MWYNDSINLDLFSHKLESSVQRLKKVILPKRQRCFFCWSIKYKYLYTFRPSTKEASSLKEYFFLFYFNLRLNSSKLIES